jgi:hypothetical protein
VTIAAPTPILALAPVDEPCWDVGGVVEARLNGEFLAFEAVAGAIGLIVTGRSEFSKFSWYIGAYLVVLGLALLNNFNNKCGNGTIEHNPLAITTGRRHSRNRHFFCVDNITDGN